MVQGMSMRMGADGQPTSAGPSAILGAARPLVTLRSTRVPA